MQHNKELETVDDNGLWVLVIKLTSASDLTIYCSQYTMSPADVTSSMSHTKLHGIAKLGFFLDQPNPNDPSKMIKTIHLLEITTSPVFLEIMEATNLTGWV
jgi:hypothetical protein